jgi:hypothetical protein
MDGRIVFQKYMIALAQSKNRGWKTIKNWDKAEARPDWPSFVRLAQVCSESLVDVDDYLESNFQLRNGKFIPSQFMHKSSIANYNRWKKLPKPDPDITLVVKSLRFIVDYCAQEEITTHEYFANRSVYPEFIRHLQNGRLHKFIFSYYVRKASPFALQEIPPDVVEHAMGKNVGDINNDMDIWWMQLLADKKSLSIIGKFFERIVR